MVVVIKIGGKALKPEFEMGEYQTINQLKTRIQLQLGVKVARQTLIFNDEILQNDRHIYDYNIGFSPTIGLVVQPLSDPKEFNIVVRSATREAETAVKETTTVGELRKRIEEEWSVCNARVFLFRLGTEMDDDDLPLSQYYICEEGCVVEVVMLADFNSL